MKLAMKMPVVRFDALARVDNEAWVGSGNWGWLRARIDLTKNQAMVGYCPWLQAVTNHKVRSKAGGNDQ